MIRKILLLFGVVLCAVLMNGCIPVIGTVTYWSEVNGKIMTATGEPIAGVQLHTAYDSMSSTGISDTRGYFKIPPVRHWYYLAHIGGMYPESPNLNSIHFGYVVLRIYSPEQNINYEIRWLCTQVENEKIPIYMFDWNTFLKNNDLQNINPDTLKTVFFEKFEFESTKPPSSITLGDEKINITFDPSFMKQLQNKTRSSIPVSSFKPLPIDRIY